MTGAHGTAAEALRRRTFAIISRPDAGKTTLTEKFLLYSGSVAEMARFTRSSSTPTGCNVSKPTTPT